MRSREWRSMVGWRDGAAACTAEETESDREQEEEGK
jgi:hypothetical protein